MLKNIAYTKTYQVERKKVDYIFTDKYKSRDDEVRNLSYSNHILKTSYYFDESYEVSKFNVRASKTDVYNFDGNKRFEIKNIYHAVDFFSEVEHSNGNNYLVFSIDLYGYSILNLNNYEVYHYIPDHPKDGTDESFIWTDIKYCKINSILSVEGCIWACPCSTYFYDFSVPENLPYRKLLSTYDLGEELNIDTDANPLHWNDDGTITLRCCSPGDSNAEIEKTINVISRSKY